MQKAILLLFAVFGLLYFLFYPFLKNVASRKKLFRWFLIIYAIAALASTVSYYYL
ncbi:hypothetical protein [uncultured Pontibacter sp.]|uniref:hypothetical protein n=1 Tax=uncultured Pontibacter sp. TaxID=453356 RepID=UPI002616726D|nr:hypothetical protein [uncultured Pontibacter sp.]